MEITYSNLQIAQAVEAAGALPADKLGECFDAVGRALLVAPTIPKGCLVCHGIGVANMPGQEGQPMRHAWIEFYIKGTLAAYDAIWDHAVPAAELWSALKVSLVVRYTRKEFMKKWKETKYPGPWDKRIKCMKGENNDRP